MNRALLLAYLFFVFMPSVTLKPAFGQIDVDRDGLLEVVVTEVKPDKQLRWIAQEIQSNEIIELGVFGQEGWQPNIGHWKSKDSLDLAVVRKEVNGQFRLALAGTREEFALGESRKKSLVFMSRDSNGTGVFDVCLVSQNKNKWIWNFSFDPFSTSDTRYRKINFGESAGYPFLFRARGKKDSIAIFFNTRKQRTARIRYRGLVNGKLIRTIRFNRKIATSDNLPIVIRSTSGMDYFVFARKNQLTTTVSKVSGRGKLISTREISPNSSVIGGFFFSNNQEDVAYIESQNLILDLQNEAGATKTTVPLQGTLILNSANIYQGSEVSSTPLPTPTSIAFH